MDIWVFLTYGLFLAAILTGWLLCWRSTLPPAQKIFWAAIILIFPIAGTIIFILIANQSKELLQ